MSLNVFQFFYSYTKWKMLGHTVNKTFHLILSDKRFKCVGSQWYALMCMSSHPILTVEIYFSVKFNFFLNVLSIILLLRFIANRF